MFDFHNLSYEEKLRERAKVALYAGNDPVWQAALKKQFKEDPIMFIELCCWTLDPKKSPSNIPFILYPFQKDYIRWLDKKLKKQESGLVEKSRQMGITCVSMAWLLHHWLFDDNFVALVGSRKEEICDKRDKQDTLFFKLDYTLIRLPKWIKPKGFNSLKDRRHLLLVNRERENTIVGESSNADFGRGGTWSCVIMDEFSTWGEAAASWNAVSEASKVKIALSTPKPMTFFKTLRFSKAMEGNVKTIHWKQHPEKDEKWYEKQKINLSADTLAQECDISYDVSGRGRVYEEFDAVPIGKYPYNPKLPLYTGSDFGLRDATSIVWAQQNKEGDVFIIDSYQNEDKTVDFYIPFYTGGVKKNERNKYTPEELRQIAMHKKWKRARHYGDPAGKNRNQVTDTSVIKVLAKAGVFVFTNDRARSFPPRREATKMLMRRLYVDERNSLFIECIKQSRYPERKDTSQATSGIARPIHDWASHFRSALEYLAVNLKLTGAKAGRIDSRESQIKRTQKDGGLTEERREVEKKKRIVRYSFKGY